MTTMYRIQRSLAGRVLVALVVLPLAGCSTAWRARFIKPEHYVDLSASEPFVKAHMFDGEVYVMRDWKVDPQKRILQGTGIHYDAARAQVGRGDFRLSLDKVALLETNQPERITTVAKGVAVMGVLTGVSLAVTVACLASPKACFGSCPTFYAEDGRGLGLQAEGFSSSVARSLEQTDVDAMLTVRADGGPLRLLMTNDALETHFVKQVRVLAVPRPQGGRVFRAGERYFPALRLHAAESCRTENGDCLEAIRSSDALEYLSLTDRKNLASRESIEIEFPRPPGRLGLVLIGRNSLLNTFLFYQVLAYMGLEAGEWIQKLEHGGERARSALQAIGKLLGDVEIEVWTARGWVGCGTFGEVGPIAKEAELFPLPPDLSGERVRVRLRLTRGNWKIDQVALAEIGEQLEPVALEVSRVERDGREDPQALARLLNPDQYLVTYPGDAYTLVFEIPGPEQELFLESRGFYYEWIRTQWLTEQDQDLAARAILDPAEALRRLAPAYKRIESSMEKIFWASKVTRRAP